MTPALRLNLGCGRHMPPGWVNVDWALGARFAKLPLFRPVNTRLHMFDQQWAEGIQLHDLRKKFPWKDASIEAIYSSHLLEHLTREEGQRFLLECGRVLKTGGLVRIVVPDLRSFVMTYVDGALPARDFVEALGVLCGADKVGLKRRLAPWSEFPHKCMYDVESLVNTLKSCGLDAAPREPFESALPDIQEIEVADRTVRAAIAEGRKR